ncbi:hypothetical protein BZG36_04117 [Bifiguratus adelaidae]|uniref:DNA mismatch repair protein MSH3 n=1 Tax=Bifiguratus adelaidae TaxID=1938954 RepID=A0A261XX54_9FUNG|nr:hypothetical protein BZG36_04117 [Bifiguratus adelaidae]
MGAPTPLTPWSKANRPNQDPKISANDKPGTPKTQKTLFSFFGTPPATTRTESQNAPSSSPLKKTVSRQDVPRPTASLSDAEPTPLVTPPRSQSQSSRQVDEVTPVHAAANLRLDSDDEEQTPQRRSRGKKRIIYDEHNSESDAEETPKRSKATPKKTERRLEEDEDGDYQMASSDDDIEPESPESKPASTSTPPKPSLLSRFQSSQASSPSKPRTPTSFLTSVTDKKKERETQFKEKNTQRYSWLQDVRDADGNPPNSPNYDPRTLYIPKSAWANFTPFEKQFWEIKGKHWDTVVFFKKGKFYELYEQDADIGHSLFDLKLTDRVNMRMVGVPEQTFDYWAPQFIAKGYKVAKVDQMETAIGKSMRERDDRKSKADKVIRRELACVLTAGTLVDSGMLTDDMSTYCMAIKETVSSDGAALRFGICFVDTATAEFNLVTFIDDVDRTKFTTLIAQIKPRELVCEKGHLSKQTTTLLKNSLPDLLWNHLIPEKEFWDAETTADELKYQNYFAKASTDRDIEMQSNMAETDDYPEAIRYARQKPALLSALGGMLWYLRSLKLDKELLSLGNVHLYDPLRNATSLVLDGHTLANLEVLQNTYDGSTRGTVLGLLNRAITPFGKRLFRNWLCHPLRDIRAITQRFDAVDALIANADAREIFAANFSSCMDLERVISRIHAGTCKVKEFLELLGAFRTNMQTVEKLAKALEDAKSVVLKELLNGFPDLTPLLDYFDEAFDLAEVDVDYQKLRTIIPRPGIEQDWDMVQEELKRIEAAFDEHLQDAKKKFKSSKICYRDIGKEIYQLEVPKEIGVPARWIRLSNTSKVNRYWTPEIKELVREYQEALETKNSIVKSFQSRVYARFDHHYATWMAATKSIAALDCLMSLAVSSVSIGEPACRPTFVDSERSVLEFEELRHPCIEAGIATDFIPNDTILGGDSANIILLTGPNMGGKSTLLRQTCVAIIMAQMGCYVPARNCTMTPIDRIYTRIGANDNILAGQSTFMVELSETSRILHEATPRSMVILDELGRGTSTYDGYAIAYAVLHYLATYVGCLGLFSTHYQTLCDEFENSPEVSNMHMAYHVNENEREVTFLYKLTPGACQKSFGMNVAHMAGVPTSIITNAEKIAAQFEASHRLRDTTVLAKERKDGQDISMATLSDFSYLLKAGQPNNNDVGDRAEDNQTAADKQRRQQQIVRRILGHGGTLAQAAHVASGKVSTRNGDQDPEHAAHGSLAAYQQQRHASSQPKTDYLIKPSLDFKGAVAASDAIETNLRNRNMPDMSMTAFADTYKTFSSKVAELNELRHERNQSSAKLKDKTLSPEQRKDWVERGRLLKQAVRDREARVNALESHLIQQALLIPNDTHPDVPIGDESKARILKVVGEPLTSETAGFPLKDHIAIGLDRDMVDFKQAALVSGSSFYYLKKAGALLELALIQYAMRKAVSRGFMPVMTPDVVRTEVAHACGFQPRVNEMSQIYDVTMATQDAGLAQCLTGTAEIPLAGLYAKTTVNQADLPIKMVGFGHAFRAEAGAHGADTRGLYRVHQFSKVELFSLTTPSESQRMMDEILELQVDMFRELGLCFRVLDMPTEELGASAHRKYDIEAWMPGRNDWGEISSTSNCTDYQARRLAIKYRSSHDILDFCHTLNGTAMAIPRMIISILETFQQPDGSVAVPKVLQPFSGETL